MRVPGCDAPAGMGGWDFSLEADMNHGGVALRNTVPQFHPSGDGLVLGLWRSERSYSTLMTLKSSFGGGCDSRRENVFLGVLPCHWDRSLAPGVVGQCPCGKLGPPPAEGWDDLVSVCCTELLPLARQCLVKREELQG